MRRSLICSLAALALAAGTASAQTGKVSLEGRGGFAVPTGELKDIGAESGLSIGADLMYSFSPRFTGYIGANRDAFGNDISAMGVNGGLKFIALRDGSVLPWLNAGIIGQQIESGGIDSGMEVGLEGGLGADIALSESFSLTPSARYRSVSADFNTTSVSANWFTFALGAHWHVR